MSFVASIFGDLDCFEHENSNKYRNKVFGIGNIDLLSANYVFWVREVKILNYYLLEMKVFCTIYPDPKSSLCDGRDTLKHLYVGSRYIRVVPEEKDNVVSAGILLVQYSAV